MEKKSDIKNEGLSDNIALQGSWQVTFQEKSLLGEPFAATFSKLISWTESKQHQIKYFSGTALYEKRFNYQKSSNKEGRAYLNLGRVGDIATIKLNGKEVGTYWKAPYIADITNHLKEGDNKLEVSVTNLWINRLIGDEKLPPEERKTATNLVNEKGRYAKLTTPNSDEYLRYAGLMGPVFIQFSGMHELPNTY